MFEMMSLLGIIAELSDCMEAAKFDEGKIKTFSKIEESAALKGFKHDEDVDDYVKEG